MSSFKCLLTPQYYAMAIQWSFHIEEHTSNMMLLCMVLILQCQALYYVVFKKVLLYTVYIKLLLIIGEDDGVIFTELIYLYYIYCMFFCLSFENYHLKLRMFLFLSPQNGPFI